MTEQTNVELERVVINRILNDPDSFFEVSGYLESKHFSVAQHRIIYDKIEEAVEEGSEVGYLVILSDLEGSGKLDNIGGKVYLEELYSEEFPNEDLKSISDRIIKNYLIREAKAVSYRIMQIDKDEYESAESLVSQGAQQLLDLVMGGSGSHTEHIQTILREEWEDIKHRLENPGISGISTGFSRLDALTSGLNPSDLMIVAARPSMGKTTFITRLMLNIARNNVPSLMFSYEMSKKQISQRMVAMESGIGLQDIKHGTVSTEELEKIKETYLDISSYPIYLDTNVSASLGYVLSTIRKYVRMSGVKVVFIDYVQLMSRESENQTAALGRISRALKGISMELDITTILVSQLNRSLETRDSKRPILSDLRQSGNLEEDADIVAMLYRPAYYGTVTEDRENLLEVSLAKHRNGPTGIVDVYFEPKTVNIFNDLAELINTKR